METRRLRKRVRGKPVESPPDWLPDGWTVEVRHTRHGKYMYYRSQASGCTFQSKEQLLRHLSAVKHDSGTSGRASRSNESKMQLVEGMKESLELLHSGWIMEIKTQKSGKPAGKTCKSPDSAKKTKSQSTGKKHHLIEEILDSNGELSETATVPDGSLQPPSSPENVKVKPEDENASESATLSPPCPRNPRVRTPEKGTRKSNISNEKAGMEASDENLNLENVTEKPSDQTIMATQSVGKKLEDETEKGREIKPESVTKPIENSKEEDEILRRAEKAVQKFSLVSNEPPDHLLGDELNLVMANQKTSAEKGNLLDPQNKNLSEVEKKELPVVVGNPSTPDLVKPKHGSRKIKAMNAISTPQRSSSRRFACIETDQVMDVDMGGERPHESKTLHKTIDSIKQLPRRRNDEGIAGNTSESLQSQNSFEGGAIMEWPDFSSTSPFGESWPDPCLEFAFKTLTGDLPVLDDAIAIQEYFQQNLFLIEGSKSPDVLAPASNNKIEDAPASDEVGIKLASEQDLLGRCQSAVMEKK